MNTKKDAFGWTVPDTSSAELAAAIAKCDEPIPLVDVDRIVGGEVVIADHEAARLYPYCNRTDTRMYPGKMVPSWAVELRARLTDAGLGAVDVGLLMKSFGLWKAPSDRQRAVAVMSVCGVARLANPGRAMRAVVEWCVANGISIMEGRGRVLHAAGEPVVPVVGHVYSLGDAGAGVGVLFDADGNPLA